jgi:UPF0755 protein
VVGRSPTLSNDTQLQKVCVAVLLVLLGSVASCSAHAASYADFSKKSKQSTETAVSVCVTSRKKFAGGEVDKSWSEKKVFCPVCFPDKAQQFASDKQAGSTAECGKQVDCASTECVSVEIRKGLGVLGIAELLFEKGLVSNRLSFILRAFMLGGVGRLQAGEYLIPKNILLSALVNMLINGIVLVHRVQIPEGFTAQLALERINSHHKLSGSPLTTIQEGSILPGTIFFSGSGVTRQKVVTMLKAGQQKLLRRLDSLYPTALRTTAGQQRPRPSVRLSKHEIIILASIVEKETNVAEEKCAIAEVFLNRLELRMPLGADPTIIYAIERETGRPLDRLLCKSDLAFASPYNTYKNRGLPPGPICCPGEESIEAVFKALTTKSSGMLYFVVAPDGARGHVFSKNLQEHNKNRQRKN